MSLQSFFRSEKSHNLYYDRIGKDDAKMAIIFLHGLAGSRRQWDKIFHALSEKYALYFPDLLGFGYSAKPRSTYTLNVHAEALQKFIQDEVKEQSIIIVGHSLGAIIGLGYAAKYPERVKKVILLSLPYYLSTEEAMLIIKANTKPQYFVIDNPATKITCMLWCSIGGPITRRILPYFLRNIPKEMASDSLLHTYNSYISTLYSVLYYQDIPVLMKNTDRKKVILIHGEKDMLVPLTNVKILAKRFGIPLHIFPKEDHGFPMEAKEKLLSVLNYQLSADMK